MGIEPLSKMGSGESRLELGALIDCWPAVVCLRCIAGRTVADGAVDACANGLAIELPESDLCMALCIGQCLELCAEEALHIEIMFRLYSLLIVLVDIHISTGILIFLLVDRLVVMTDGSAEAGRRVSAKEIAVLPFRLHLAARIISPCSPVMCEGRRRRRLT